MSRLVGILTAVSVVVVAMVFAALNAGNLVTVNLGLFTLYRAPVALVAFGGLFTGMVVMFATGVHTDLKVRRILRERLAEESREEQKWIDRNQQDLFENQPEVPETTVGLPASGSRPEGSRESPPEPPQESSSPGPPQDSASASSEESSRQAPDEPRRDPVTEDVSPTGEGATTTEDEDRPMR